MSEKQLLKKLNLTLFRASIDIFEYPVLIVIGDHKKAEKYISWKFDEEVENSAVAGRTFHKKGYAPIVWLPKIPKTSEELGTLNHELAHIVFGIFRHIDSPNTDDTQEHFCYILGYLTREFLTQFKKTL